MLATHYAKSVIRNTDQGLAQAYAAALRPRQNVYSRALEDFMSPPVVQEIEKDNYYGAAGDKIVVRAMDDFRVTGVRVEIYDAGGALLEAGNAVQNLNGSDLTYTATKANTMTAGSKIKAIASDIQGNKGSMDLTL